jgi:hypothetical protein
MNEAALALTVSAGHRTGLFDVMAAMPAETRAEIASLDERYVREWLAVMTTGRIVGHDGTLLAPGELLGLAWDDVSLGRAELHVSEQLQRRAAAHPPRGQDRRLGGAASPARPVWLRSRCAGNSSTPPGTRPTTDGLRQAWCSPRATAPLSDPVTSRGASIAVSTRPRFAGLPCTALVSHAGPCWQPWTSTLAWPGRSFATARSPSPWRSTPRSCPQPPDGPVAAHTALEQGAQPSPALRRGCPGPSQLDPCGMLRPAASRTRVRSPSCSRARVPSSRQAAKYPYTVNQGGKSRGRYRQAHPCLETSATSGT